MSRLARAVAALSLALGPPALAQDRAFDSNGVPIRYVERGKGEPIVLIHGHSGSLELWTLTGVLQNLARDYRVIAFDARGHGKSGKPHDPQQYGREMTLDIVRLLDHLGVERAHIVGYSMGAQLTAQLLTLRPDRFLTATLVGGAGRLQWTAEDARTTEQEAGEMEEDCVSRTQLARLAPPGAPPLSDRDFKALAAVCFANRSHDRFAVAAVRRSYADQVISPAEVSNVKVPTLGIVGDLDPARRALEALQALRPGLELVVVEGATHGGERGIVGRPEFLRALRGFLAANRARSP